MAIEESEMQLYIANKLYSSWSLRPWLLMTALGIPFDEIQQTCLTPLAYTVGTDFKRAMRPEPDSIIHWDTW